MTLSYTLQKHENNQNQNPLINVYVSQIMVLAASLGVSSTLNDKSCHHILLHHSKKMM